MLLYYKDIVKIDLTTGSGSEYEIELHEVRERFGKFGKQKVAPICTGVVTKVIRDNEFLKGKIGKKIFFDYTFITNVVSRSGLGDFPKINIHKRNAPAKKTIQVKRDKKLLCGPIKELCRIYLGQLNEQIIADVDWDKVNHRVKSLTGVVDKYENFIYTVKKDHFDRWFKKIGDIFCKPRNG